MIIFVFSLFFVLGFCLLFIVSLFVSVLGFCCLILGLANPLLDAFMYVYLLFLGKDYPD